MSADPWITWWRTDGEEGLRRVLMESWDPIGIADQPAAADEYDSYVLALGGRLRAGATPEEIASYLSHIRRERMELLSHADADVAAARSVLEWYSGSIVALEWHEPGAEDT
jgi:hypothetical protein